MRLQRLTVQFVVIWAAAHLIAQTVVSIATAQTAQIDAGLDESLLASIGIKPTLEDIQSFLNAAVAPSDEETARLIADLGHSNFAVRAKAANQLLGLAAPPIEGLRSVASKSADPGQAMRAEAILKKLQSGEGSPLGAALRVVQRKRLAVGLPLLLTVHRKVATPQVHEYAIQAVLAIASEAERQAANELLNDTSAAMRNVGRRLLVQLENSEATPILEGTMDAIRLKPGSVAGGGNNLIAGWEFEARVKMSVTHLGIYDEHANGLEQPHQVAIWDVKDPAKPVAQVTIPAGDMAELRGVFRMMAIDRKELAAGKHYAVVAHFSNPSDHMVDFANPSGLEIEYAVPLKVIGRRYSSSQKEMAFPTQVQSDAKSASIGPTFRLHVSSESIEPAMAAAKFHFVDPKLATQEEVGRDH